jgi:phytoene synthase
MDVAHGSAKAGGTERAAVNAQISYPADIVRRYDRDRFLLGMTVPGNRRDALWALFAFNHEIAKTREVVSEPTLGLIRLQWWRDAIEKLYAGTVLQHEVLTALAATIRDYALPRARFDELIDARERDLENRPLSSFADLERYADATSTPLNRLVLKVLGQEEPEEKIRDVSTAFALTGLLRAVAYRDNFLPHGVKTGELVERIGDKLDAAKPLRGYLKASAALTMLYLARIKRHDYDPTKAAVNAPPVTFAVKALAGRFR